MIEKFLSSIILEDKEYESATFYLNVRGIAEHEMVRDYLVSMTGGKITYSQIATAMRYDKRIRRIVFKYIGLLEEYIRAYLCNKYSSNYSMIDKANGLKKALSENKNFYDAIESLTFNKLISQIKFMPEDDKIEIFDNYKSKEDWFVRDLDAIVALRDEVSHNRFILNSVRLKKNSAGDNNGSLWSNLVNLKNYLPIFARRTFANEINESTIPSEKKYPNQTEWDLIPSIIVELAQD